MLARYTWLVQAIGTNLFHGPGKARRGDRSVAVYEMAELVGAEAEQATAAVFMLILGSAMGEVAAVSLNRRLTHEGGDAEGMIRETMAKQTRIAMQFPRLRARVESLRDAVYYSAPDNSFEFGLEAIFDGPERQLIRNQPR